MGRKRSRLTEKRLVPFEAARHVAYPMIVHVRFIRSPSAEPNSSLDRPGHNGHGRFLADRESSHMSETDPLKLANCPAIRTEHIFEHRCFDNLSDRSGGVASRNGRLPFWRFRRSPLLLRRALQRG